MVILVPIAAAGFAAWRWHRNHKQGILTKERLAIFKAAMATIEDPVKLERLASVYDSENLPDLALQLRARAALPGKSDAEKSAMQDGLKQALLLTDPKAVLKVADKFKAQGATATEGLLRQYAAGLAASKTIPTSAPPAPAPVAAAVPLAQSAAPAPAPNTPLPNPSNISPGMG